MPLDHVLGDAWRRVLKSKLEQFAVDARRSPKRPRCLFVGSTHADPSQSAGFPLEWLPGEMFTKGVFWIDLFKFTPNAAGLIYFTEMTKSGSKYGACQICPGHKENTLPVNRRRGHGAGSTGSKALNEVKKSPSGRGHDRR